MARVISPRRHAPAVCDEEGPTMVGPRMSKSDTMARKIGAVDAACQTACALPAGAGTVSPLQPDE